MDSVHAPRGDGCFLRIGGIARPAGASRQACGGWREAGSTRRRFCGKLRSAEIRHSFRYAVANREPAVSGRDISGWTPREILRVERPPLDNPREIIANRGNL